jgi:hypothetical protein
MGGKASLAIAAAIAAALAPAAALVAWAGPEEQRTAAAWRRLADRASAEHLAARVEAALPAAFGASGSTAKGSDPTLSSTRHAAPSTLPRTTTVQTRAFKSGATDSTDAAATLAQASAGGGKVGKPVIAPDGATFTGSQTVSISTATVGAEIRHTTDGSKPRATSALYTGPLTVDESTTVRAIATKAGMTASDVENATFCLSGHEGCTTADLTNLVWDESHAGDPLDLDGFQIAFAQEFNAPTSLKGPALFASVHSDVGAGTFDGADSEAYAFVKEPDDTSELEVTALRLRGFKDARGKWHGGIVETADGGQAYRGVALGNGKGFACRNCYFEARIKFPQAIPGLWGALWLLSPDSPVKGHVEVDILEWYGGDPKGHHTSLHVWPKPPSIHTFKSNYAGMQGVITDGKWHTYGVHIGNPQVIVYMDGKEVARAVAPPEFQQKLYMLVNNAQNPKEIARATSPMDMYVDYIRAYKDAASQATVAPAVPAPTVALRSDKTTVRPGGSATLTWSSMDAERCTLSGFTSRTKLKGSATVSPPRTRTYAVACTGPGGTASKDVTLTVSHTIPAPSIEMWANKPGPKVQPGDGLAVSWHAMDAASCTASGSWSGTKAARGTSENFHPTTPPSYKLTCSGPGGTSTKTIKFEF